MPGCDLCLDLAKRDVSIRCVEWKFPWQRDCQADRGVTYAFYPGKRNNEPPEGEQASSELSRDQKNPKLTGGSFPSALWDYPPSLFLKEKGRIHQSLKRVAQEKNVERTTKEEYFPYADRSSSIRQRSGYTDQPDRTARLTEADVFTKLLGWTMLHTLTSEPKP